MQVRAAGSWRELFQGCRITTLSLLVASSGLKPLGLSAVEGWKGAGLSEEMPGHGILQSSGWQ